MDEISFENFKIKDPLDPSNFFKLKITKDFLIDAGFTVFGNRDKIKADMYFDVKNGFISGSIENSVQMLTDLINNKENGIVKILPLINSKDEGIGYHYFIPSNEFGATRPHTFLPKDPNQPYWVIGLNNDEANSKETLKKIIRLMLFDDYAFVIKNKDGEWNDGLATAIFNRHGFLNIQDFFSGTHEPGYYHQMPIDSFYNSFDINEFLVWNDIWDAIWTFYTKLTLNEMNKY